MAFHADGYNFRPPVYSQANQMTKSTWMNIAAHALNSDVDFIVEPLPFFASDADVVNMIHALMLRDKYKATGAKNYRDWLDHKIEGRGLIPKNKLQHDVNPFAIVNQNHIVGVDSRSGPQNISINVQPRADPKDPKDKCLKQKYENRGDFKYETFSRRSTPPVLFNNN